MIFTAALAAHLLGLDRRLKIGLWVWLGLTTARHRPPRLALRPRRLAGVPIAVGALALARALTGFDLRALRVTTA